MRRLFQIFGRSSSSSSKTPGIDNKTAIDNINDECKTESNNNHDNNDNDDDDDNNDDINNIIHEYEEKNNDNDDNNNDDVNDEVIEYNDEVIEYNDEVIEYNNETIFANDEWLNQTIDNVDDDVDSDLDWSTSLLPFPTIIKRINRNKKGLPHEPILEWNNTEIPEASRIVYPQPLTDIQLSASVRNVLNMGVNGKVVYNPPRGSILKAGSHEIVAIFIPQNTSHYRSVSISKTIKVIRGTPKLSWVPPSLELSVSIGLGSGLPKEYLNCKCTRLKGGKFYYTNKPGSKLDRGYRTIGCRYEPSEKNSKNYKNGFSQIVLHITGYIPEMNWPPIKASPYPLKLSKLHYNIRPNDPKIFGSFEYDPPLLTLFSVGTYELNATFTPDDSYRYMKSTYTNKVEIIKGVPILDWPQPASVYEGTVLDERMLRCSCTTNIPGIFEYDPPLGTILVPGTIPLKVLFTPNDTINYECASGEARLTIHNKLKPLVQWEEPDYITHPAPLARSELNAVVSGHIRGRFIYEPPLGTVLPAGIHHLKVKFISETVGKSDSEGSTTLEVRKGVARLLWDTPYPVLEGQPITSSVLNCVCTNDIKGTFTYNIKLGSILSAGKHKLHVKFDPDEENSNNFFGAEEKQILEVRTRGKKRPTITWSNPNDITHPQPLTDVHLNAVCSGTGTLNYFPDLDTILDVGEHILSVSFQPLHRDIYLPVSGEVTIKVLPGVPKITWKPVANLIYGQELSHEQLNAECDCCDGEFEYIPDFKTILDSGDHTLIAKYYPDTPNYLPTEVTAAILIQRGRAVIEWNPYDKIPKPIEFPFFINQDMHLNAKLIYPKHAKGKFKYSVQHNDLLHAGTHILTCRFYPDDIVNMYSGDASITIVVDKAAPRIQWKNGLKDYMLYGTSLNEKKHYGIKMLSVIEGEWSYDPPLKFVLDVGEHVLSATFTPTDLENYKPGTISRTVRVNELQLT